MAGQRLPIEVVQARGKTIMILKAQLMVMEPTEEKVAVKYVTNDNLQYAFNGMPGALLTVLMPRVLNSEVTNIEASGEYISVTIKEPAAATTTSGS